MDVCAEPVVGQVGVVTVMPTLDEGNRPQSEGNWTREDAQRFAGSPAETFGDGGHEVAPGDEAECGGAGG